MSIYHCSISNSKGAVASSAYIEGEKRKNQDDIYDYTSRTDVVYKNTLLADEAPQEWKDSEQLWQAVAQAEKKGGRQAKKIEVALPKEWTLEEQIKACDDFAEEFRKQGHCITYAIHDKGDGNPHAHFLLTLRLVEKGKFKKTKCKTVYSLDKSGKKIPLLDVSKVVEWQEQHGGKEFDLGKATQKDIDFCQKKRVRPGKGAERLWQSHVEEDIPCSKKEWLQGVRQNWETLLNSRLPEDLQVSCKSYIDQGIDLIPTIHEGYYARKIAQKGGLSMRCEYNKEVRKRNRKKWQTYNYMASPLFSFEGEWFGKSSQIFLTRNKKVAFVDTKDTILVRRNDTKTLAEALKHAQEKWGSVKLKGADDYIEKCIDLAIRNNIQITNPELQKRIEAKKQAIARKEQENNDLKQKEELYEQFRKLRLAEDARANGQTTKQGAGDKQPDTGKQGQGQSDTGIDYEAIESGLDDIQAANDNIGSERRKRELKQREQRTEQTQGSIQREPATKTRDEQSKKQPPVKRGRSR